jgi:hypothetical protein
VKGVELALLAELAASPTGWAPARHPKIAFSPKKPSSPSTVKFHRKKTPHSVFFAGRTGLHTVKKQRNSSIFRPFPNCSTWNNWPFHGIRQQKPHPHPKTLSPNPKPFPPLPKFTVHTVRTVKREETARRRVSSQSQKRMHLQSRDLQGTCSVAVSEY